MWPMLLDIPKDECKRILRRLELEAYGSLVSALRGQGELSKTKRQFLQEAASVFHISTERHRAEIRRAVNDEKLSTIAERLVGPNTGMEWAIEGRRLVPLMPRLTPQTAFTALANKVANVTAAENAKLPPPQTTAQSPEIGELEEPAAPESSRTTQNQAVNIPASSSHQPPAVQMTKVEENDTRKRRRSSLEICGQPLSPTMQPLTKVAAVGLGTQPVPRTLTIPMNVAPVKLSIAATPVRSTVSTSSSGTTQKVIIMSGSTPVCSASLLQRSLSVPMVKTVATAGTLNSPSTLVSSSLGQPRATTTMGIMSAIPGQSGVQRLRPKPVATTTVLPRGRTGSIVIPLTPNPPNSVATASLQLKPAGSMQHKPTLHIKQDGSGMKIIAGGPKLMPKPATVVATTTAGTTRVVTLTATPRVSPSLSSTSMSQHLAQTSHAPTTYMSAKPVTQVGVVSKPMTQLSMASTSGATTSKANVIVVKKGTGYTAGQGVTLTQAGRELIGKVMIRNPQSSQGQKVTASQSGTAQTITMQTGTRQGNVIVVDLSQEPIKPNSVLSEILQASGILTTPSTPVSQVSQTQRPYVYLDDSNESQEEQRSPSSSTDTGSSLELNQAGDTSLDDDPEKLFTPSTSRQINAPVTTKTPALLLSSTIHPQNIVTKSLEIVDEKEIELTPATKQQDVTEADMQKIEEEMMNLGEGTQLEALQTELEQETSILVAPETTDSNETSDTQEMEVETTESQDQSCSLSLEQVVSEDTTSMSNLIVEPVSETIGNIIFETTSESSDNKITDTLSDEVSNTMDISMDADEERSLETAIQIVEKAAEEVKNDNVVLISASDIEDAHNMIVEVVEDANIVSSEVTTEPQSKSKQLDKDDKIESTEFKIEDIAKLASTSTLKETGEEKVMEIAQTTEVQAQLEECQVQEALKEGTLIEVVPQVESTTEEVEVQEEGHLDPQSGLFSLKDATEVPTTKRDIYSAAISSANITFDSEPEIVDQKQADSEEEISLVYTEPEDVMVKVDEGIETEPLPISSDDKVSEVVEPETNLKEDPPLTSEAQTMPVNIEASSAETKDSTVPMEECESQSQPN